MKILISDYDGTINRFSDNVYLSDLISLKRDVLAIKRFINKGNLFVISTGRSFVSMYNEINKFKLKYNYLTVNNGLVTFDYKNNIVDATYLNKEFIRLINDLDGIISKIQLLNEYGINSKNNIVRIKFIVNDIKLFYNEIEKHLKYYNLCMYSNLRDFTIQSNTDKTDGINKLVEKIDMPGETKIITVGNSINDADMIKSFDGYYMFDESEFINYFDKKVVKNIRELVKKL